MVVQVCLITVIKDRARISADCWLKLAWSNVRRVSSSLTLPRTKGFPEYSGFPLSLHWTHIVGASLDLGGEHWKTDPLICFPSFSFPFLRFRFPFLTFSFLPFLSFPPYLFPFLLFPSSPFPSFPFLSFFFLSFPSFLFRFLSFPFPSFPFLLLYFILLFTLF